MIIRKLYEIPTSLTHSLGQITATFPSASYNVNLTGLTANTLYFLYTRKISNVASLVYSTTIPSTYRVSFPGSVLIGAFYSNGLVSVGFGSFVNIEGVPQSSRIDFLPIASLTTNAVYRGTWQRVGQTLHMNVVVDFTGATNAVTQSYSPPTNLTIDTAALKTSATSGVAAHGAGQLFDSSATIDFGVIPSIQVNNWILRNTNGTSLSNVSNLVPVSIANNDSISINANAPILNWNNISIKDL